MDDVEKNASTLSKLVNIVAAYVSHNSVPAADLPELIASVHASISGLTPGAEVVDSKPAEAPAVSIKKSITNDHLVCLEDGKKFKSLRRHLSSFHNMTPEEYRAKWNLPVDYPMVAPSYSATRSQLAKESGLGQLGKTETGEVAPEIVDEPTSDVKKSGRGRPRKTDA